MKQLSHLKKSTIWLYCCQWSNSSSGAKISIVQKLKFTIRSPTAFWKQQNFSDELDGTICKCERISLSFYHEMRQHVDDLHISGTRVFQVAVALWTRFCTRKKTFAMARKVSGFYCSNRKLLQCHLSLWNLLGSTLCSFKKEHLQFCTMAVQHPFFPFAVYLTGKGQLFCTRLHLNRKIIYLWFVKSCMKIHLERTR